jgi:hypothetical protein
MSCRAVRIGIGRIGGRDWIRAKNVRAKYVNRKSPSGRALDRAAPLDRHSLEPLGHRLASYAGGSRYRSS